jgi:hypothetical protein
LPDRWVRWPVQCVTPHCLLPPVVACYNCPVTGIDQFEALVEQLVEGTFGRLFPPPLHSSDLVRNLLRAMEGERQVVDDHVVLPNRYWVMLNPVDYAAMEDDQPARLGDINHCLHRLAREVEGRFCGRLLISFHPSPEISVGHVEVRAAHAPWPAVDVVDTRAMATTPDRASEASQWMLRLDSCSYRLGEPVISMGRGLANDIILDDPRVSRRHARLRWRDGRYFLSDLDSSHGVWINDRSLPRGAESPLVSGDRINLAGLVLVVERAGAPADGFAKSAPDSGQAE